MHVTTALAELLTPETSFVRIVFLLSPVVFTLGEKKSVDSMVDPIVERSTSKGLVWAQL
jgi:hypothetical protein